MTCGTQWVGVRSVVAARPSDSGEGYEVAIQWTNETRFTATIDVDAALEVDGDDEVGYGEAVKFKGSGFSEGLAVRMHQGLSIICRPPRSRREGETG